MTALSSPGPPQRRGVLFTTGYGKIDSADSTVVNLRAPFRAPGSSEGLLHHKQTYPRVPSLSTPPAGVRSREAKILSKDPRGLRPVHLLPICTTEVLDTFVITTSSTFFPSVVHVFIYIALPCYSCPESAGTDISSCHSPFQYMCICTLLHTCTRSLTWILGQNSKCCTVQDVSRFSSPLVTQSPGGQSSQTETAEPQARARHKPKTAAPYSNSGDESRGRSSPNQPTYHNQPP